MQAGKGLKLDDLKLKAKYCESEERETLRRSYRPDKVKVLLIGESPPASGDFFYRKSAMTIHTWHAFENVYGVKFGNNVDFLSFFRARGCYLDDLSLTPVNAMPKRERTQKLRESVHLLYPRILEVEPDIVVAVLLKIEPYVREAVALTGRDFRFDALPFPGDGHQSKYIERLSAILREYAPSSNDPRVAPVARLSRVAEPQAGLPKPLAADAARIGKRSEAPAQAMKNAPSPYPLPEGEGERELAFCQRPTLTPQTAGRPTSRSGRRSRSCSTGQCRNASARATLGM